MYKEANDADFGSLLSAKGYLIAYFFATWCGPCKVFAPVFAEVAQELASETVTFAKINIDHASQVASEYGISSIPTIVFFSQGKQVRSVAGVQRKEDLIAAVRMIQQDEA